MNIVKPVGIPVSDEIQKEARAWCNLCRPALLVPIHDLAAHLKFEHDFDMRGAEAAARWPDPEPVVLDQALESEGSA